MILVAFLMSFTSSAAVKNISPMELLSLPEANRLQVVKEQRDPEIYKNLVGIAFSDERSEQTRWRALVTAAQINPQGCAKDMERALHHKDWFMRSAALMALKTVNEEASEKAAITLLEDKALMVRSMAVNVLSENPSMAARAALWAEFRSEKNIRKGQSLWIRGEILEKLSAYPEKYEYSFFSAALREKDAEFAVPVMQALGKLTRKKMGTAKTSVEERKKLWVQYTKEHSIIK